MSIHRKPTDRMCWGKVQGVAPCSAKTEWKLNRLGDPPEKAVYTCDAHLGPCLRRLGLPAVVEEEETTQRIKSIPPES